MPRRVFVASVRGLLLKGIPVRGPESGMEIEYHASRSVRERLASLGRAEDLRFSPNNSRLAVAGFIRDRIAVFDIDIRKAGDDMQVTLTGGVELSSPALSRPHGLDFIDDETLVVANRAGDVSMFRLPAGTADVQSCAVAPIQTLAAGGTNLLNVPGSVSVVGGVGDLVEILICNNAGSDITRHRLDGDGGHGVRSSEVLLRKWLDVPDGVCVSRDRQWLAVSNHGSHCVLLYEYAAHLSPAADPDGMLRGILYPHGVRFTSDGHHVFVAAAGSPYLHVYAQNGDGWRGVRHPAASIRIMDESLFLRGHSSPAEGGPKGIDIDAGQNVLAVASECRPLAFFDLSAILSHVDADSRGQSQREQNWLAIEYELHILRRREEERKQLFTSLNHVKNSKSWRITAPLRRLDSVLRRSR
jgi:hypothetical protein